MGVKVGGFEGVWGRGRRLDVGVDMGVDTGEWIWGVGG